jgi:RHS repeat-associated protein
MLKLKKLLFGILITSILFQGIVSPIASAYTTNPSSLIYELPVRESSTRDFQSSQYEKVIYHHNDHLSSSSIDTDQNGNLINAVNYEPFGAVKTEQINSDYRNPKRYTGKELDGTGLYYYSARYYDPSIGRFVSQDPVDGFLINPQSLNKYSYVLNNPLKYIDPTGEIAMFFPLAVYAVQFVETVATFTTLYVIQKIDSSVKKNTTSNKTNDENTINIPTNGVNTNGGTGTPNGIDPKKDKNDKKENKEENIKNYKPKINEKTYNNAEKDLKNFGPENIYNRLKGSEKALTEHILKYYNPLNKYKSSIKTTIKNVKNNIKTYKKFIKDKGL